MMKRCLVCIYQHVCLILSILLFLHPCASDDSLRTPYSVESARADYHATLTLLSQLESQIHPIASIGYDTKILDSFHSQPPVTPQEAISRFATDITNMNTRLKTESTLLQSIIAQQSNQTKLASKEYKLHIDRMKLGEVNKQQLTENNMQTNQQQLQHNNSYQHQQQQQQQHQAMRR